MCRLNGSIIAVVLVLTAIFMCGCQQNETNICKEESESSRTVLSSEKSEGAGPTESSLDAEIQTAIDAHESKSFFMLNGDTREMPEGLSIWTCSRLNCTQLWPELRNQLFPEAEGGTEARPGEGGSMYELTVDGKTVEVTVSPNVIGFSFVSSKRAKDFAEKLADVMTEKTGAGISDHAEEHFSNRRFAATAELNGLPLDLHFIGDDGFPQLCGIYQLGKEIYLSNPIGELLSSEAVSSESLLTLDDLEVSVEFESEIKKETFTKTVTVYDRCESVFRFDEKSGTLRPAWRASGNRYIYWVDSGKTTTEHAELLFDALTGEMFSVEEQLI